MLRKVLFALGFAAFFNLFLFRPIGSGAIAVFLLGAFAFILGVFWKNGIWEKQRNLIFVSGILTLDLVFNLVRSANLFVQFISTVSVLATYALISYLFATEREFFDGIGELIFTPFNLFFSYIRTATNLFSAFFSTRMEVRLGGGWVKVVRGLLIAVPVGLILVGLLSAGDPIFGHFVSQSWGNLGNLFTWNFWQRPLTHIIFSVIVFSGALTFAYLWIKKTVSPRINLSERIVEVGVVLIFALLILGVFLIVQWPYVFVTVAKETSLSQFGVATYSEYVRRGFFELILVSVLVYALSWVGHYAHKEAKSRWFGAVQIGLIAEFFLFVASIFRRVILYIQFHGLSIVRVYGSLFLILIIGLFGILIIRHFVRKDLIKIEIGLIAGFLVILGLINAEALVVMIPPTVNKKVDYVYLSKMSPDGLEGWTQAWQYANRTLEDEGYLSKKLLTSDDRREIYYANLIVDSLENKKMHLVKAGNQDRGFLNKVFSFNYSERVALAKVNMEMSDERLKELRLEYAALYRKIMAQPIQERDFVLDVSLQSPFLN